MEHCLCVLLDHFEEARWQGGMRKGLLLMGGWWQHEARVTLDLLTVLLMQVVLRVEVASRALRKLYLRAILVHVRMTHLTLWRLLCEIS